MNFIEKVKVAGKKLVEKPKSESEYRDAAHSNLKCINNLGDLKTVYKLSQLLADLNEDNYNDRDYDLRAVIYFILNEELTVKNVCCIGRLLTGLIVGGRENGCR